MSGIDSDLIRGHIDTIILKVLSDGDKYGIEICKEVEEKSNGTYELKQPTLYSCLKRLENQGLISSYWEDSDIGGKRHYYKLTDEGKNTYRKNQEEWMRSRQIIDNLISNSFEEASSYTLMKKQDVEDLEKKAELVEGVDIQSESDEQDNSSLSFNQIDEDNIIPWSVNTENNKNETDDNEEYYSWKETVELTDDNKNFLAEVAPNGEITAVSFSEVMEETEDDAEVKDEEIPGQASIFESDEESINFSDNVVEDPDEETTEELDIMQLLGHTVETPIQYEERLQIEAKEEPLLPAPEETKDEELEEEIAPFNFKMEDFVTKSRNSYFDSEEVSSKNLDYVAPEMKIDGIEEPSIVESSDDEIYTPDTDELSTPVYHDFGTDSFIKNFDHKIEETEEEVSDEDAIYLDESNYDPDSLYLNPDIEKEKESNELSIFEDDDEDTLKLFSEDIFEEEKETLKNQETIVEKINSNSVVNTEIMDFYKSTDNYENIEAKYTEDEYKQKLSSLMSYANSPKQEQKEDSVSITQSIKENEVKDYSDLKAEFEKEGLTVRPHYKMVKESRATRSYVESNKLNLINSWTAFGIVSFLTLLTYLIMANNNTSCFGFSYKYFLIGISILAIIPVIYTFIYFINPYKKKPARYAARFYLLFAILLTVQLLLIIYCVNLQLGFYSFRQENYNHLYWAIPCILSLYPLADAILHTVFFNSKNFHV